jgi:hypothetical protein
VSQGNGKEKSKGEGTQRGKGTKGGDMGMEALLWLEGGVQKTQIRNRVSQEQAKEL